VRQEGGVGKRTECGRKEQGKKREKGEGRGREKGVERREKGW
jgi:hypothetical protein